MPKKEVPPPTEGIANIEDLPKVLEPVVGSSIVPDPPETPPTPPLSELGKDLTTAKEAEEKVDVAHPDRTKRLDPRPAAPKQVQRVYQAEALRYIRDAIVDLKASLRYLRPLDFEGEQNHPSDIVEGMVASSERIRDLLLLVRKNA